MTLFDEEPSRRVRCITNNFNAAYFNGIATHLRNSRRMPLPDAEMYHALTQSHAQDLETLCAEIARLENLLRAWEENE